MNMTDILQLNIHFRHFDYIPFYAIVENTALFCGRTCAKVFSSLCFLGWLCQKKSERVWEGCGEMEPLCVASGNVK